jgi:hypothetical protein
MVERVYRLSKPPLKYLLLVPLPTLGRDVGSLGRMYGRRELVPSFAIIPGLKNGWYPDDCLVNNMYNKTIIIE